MDADIAKLLGSGGIAAALLALIYIVGMRIVAAIDRVATKVDEHTSKDLAAHADVKSDLAELRGKLDGFLDASDHFTPVGVEPPKARRESGAYGPLRPSTKGER